MELDLQRRDRSSPTPELTPLIDVVFQLLVFFLLTTTFTLPVVPLTLPESTSGQGRREETRLTISITPEGEIYIGDTVLPVDKLERVIAQRLSLEPQQPVVIRGDIRARYGTFMNVLDACQRARAARVLLETTPAVTK